MPRYHFNVRDGQPIIRDRVGTELPNLNAAIAKAQHDAELVVSGLMGKPELLKDLKVQITDAEGKELAQVQLPDPKEFAR